MGPEPIINTDVMELSFGIGNIAVVRRAKVTVNAVNKKCVLDTMPHTQRIYLFIGTFMLHVPGSYISTSRIYTPKAK